jgi:hypothetical protein
VRTAASAAPSGPSKPQHPIPDRSPT